MSLQTGDRVLAMAEQGGYAEAVAVAADQCYHLPSPMSFDEAASLGLASTPPGSPCASAPGWSPARRCWCSVPPAPSGMRQYSWRARWVRASLPASPEPRRAADVLAAGADAVIDLSRPNLRDSLREQVFAVTEGRGADIVLDPLGGEVFEAALRALAWRGRLVVIGFAAGAIPTMRVNYLLLKNIEVSGLQISDYRKRRPAQVAAAFAEIFGFYEQGKIKPAPVTAFPLERAGEALAALRDRRLAGRTVLHMFPDGSGHRAGRC